MEDTSANLLNENNLPLPQHHGLENPQEMPMLEAGERSLHEHKGSMPLSWNDLNENSTRYDYFEAAPSDAEVVRYWFSWSTVAFAMGAFSFLVFLTIVTNRTIRRKPFNLYLIYLTIPDFLFSILCGITCLMNAVNGEYWSHWMCNWQQFYVVFGFSANCWLNAIIGRQLHTILLNSRNCQRYQIPSTRTVTKQALAVYAWSILLGGLGVIEAPTYPHESGLASGLACLPIEGRSVASSGFFWLCFFPLFAGIPILAVLWICWDVYRRKLLPPSGQRRLLSIYFRLILVFLIMWVPTILMLFVFTPWLPPWARFIGGLWSHLQGGVSAFIVLLKPDIRQSFLAFVSCGKIKYQDQDGLETPERTGGKGSCQQRAGSSSNREVAGESARSDSAMRDFGLLTSSMLEDGSSAEIPSTDEMGSDDVTSGTSDRDVNVDEEIGLHTKEEGDIEVGNSTHVGRNN